MGRAFLGAQIPYRSVPTVPTLVTVWAVVCARADGSGRDAPDLPTVARDQAGWLAKVRMSLEESEGGDGRRKLLRLPFRLMPMRWEGKAGAGQTK